MTSAPTILEPGLYLVATPIGSARDITLRALDILGAADVLAAEDTRTLRKLLQIHGVPLGDRPLIAYHDHNGAAARPRILRALAEGRSVAYASEAGTPLVADPGYQLVRAAIEAGHKVTGAPGPSAAVAALAISGLPTDRFLFVGFPPTGKAARRAWASELAGVPATLVLYESPRRLAKTLRDLADVMGPDRDAAICREITKKFEEVIRGTLGDLAEKIAEAEPKGEIVLLVGRGDNQPRPGDMEQALRDALETMSIKDAAQSVSEALGVPKRQVYQAALEMAKTRS